MTFDEVYAKHARVVLGRCRRLVGDADAADVAQQVWLKVAINLPRFRGEAQISSWLFRITENVAADYYRRVTRRPWGYEDAWNLQMHDRPCPRPTPEGQVEFAQQRRELRRRLSALPPSIRRTLVVWMATGCDKVTGALLSTSRKTVRSRVHRGKQMLGGMW